MSSQKKFDIFLSYQWSKKNEVKELYTKLTSDLEYKVWMDDYQLVATAGLYDQLAKGLNDSKCLVACITEKYCKSENCKLELEYAQTHKIPIICIMLEKLPLNEGSISLLINSKLRLNFYEIIDESQLWSGVMFEKLKESIQIAMGSKNIINFSNVNNTVNININQTLEKNNCISNLKYKKRIVIILLAIFGSSCIVVAIVLATIFSTKTEKSEMTKITITTTPSITTTALIFWKPIWQTDENGKYALNCDFTNKNEIAIIRQKLRLKDCGSLCIANINCTLYNWAPEICVLKYGNLNEFTAYYWEELVCGIVTRNYTKILAF